MAADTSGERISVAELIGLCKYIYVRPSLLAKAKERFGNDAIVSADWRLDVEDRDWYVSSCPVPVPERCATPGCVNPLGRNHQDVCQVIE